jgi:hypothetical protein
MLKEDGLRLITKLINNIYETEEWPKDFIKATNIALRQKAKATKCKGHRTYSENNSEYA